MSPSTDTTTTKLGLQQIALLLEQNKALVTVNDGLTQSMAELFEHNSELREVNDTLIAENKTLKAQLQQAQKSAESLKQTQDTLSGQLNELDKSSRSLAEANIKQQRLLTKKDELIASLQNTLKQRPQSAPAPSMTTHDEQELLDLLSSKNDLIQQQQAMVEDQNTTIASLKALIDELDR